MNFTISKMRFRKIGFYLCKRHEPIPIFQVALSDHGVVFLLLRHLITTVTKHFLELVEDLVGDDVIYIELQRFRVVKRLA